MKNCLHFYEDEQVDKQTDWWVDKFILIIIGIPSTFEVKYEFYLSDVKPMLFYVFLLFL